MAEIKVPELAESISEGTIAQWLKQPGDYVEQGEFLLELETDKVNVELTAEQSGVLQEVLKDSGDTVQVGENNRNDFRRRRRRRQINGSAS